jgi:hypothetical protein
MDATAQDDESVVADECHIISARIKGPRHDPTYSAEKIDSYENLILLCRTHHKMVDDQASTFTTEILRQIKLNHEVWVKQKLSEDADKKKPIRLKRVKQNMPSFLFRLTTGKEVLDLVMDAMAYAFDHDDLKSQEEVDLVGGFLQAAQDWGDLRDCLETSDRVQIAFELTASLQELEKSGFFVFGGKEVQLLEGGALPEPSNWPVAIIRVLRKDNNSIMKFDTDNIGDERTQT